MLPPKRIYRGGTLLDCPSLCYITSPTVQLSCAAFPGAAALRGSSSMLVIVLCTYNQRSCVLKDDLFGSLQTAPLQMAPFYLFPPNLTRRMNLSALLLSIFVLKRGKKDKSEYEF